MGIVSLSTDTNYDALINSLSTPCYIIDRVRLDTNVEKLIRDFDATWPGNVRYSYSIKTNSLPWIVTYMKKLGFRAEVVSDQEYRLARKLGFNKGEIVYNGPAKGENILIESLNGGGIVNLDNFSEIEILQHYIDARTRDWKVGLRYNFDLESVCPGETIAGENRGRFGFCIENGDFDAAIKKLRSLGVKVVGLHGHNSTKTKSLKVFSAIAQTARGLIDRYDLQLEYFDIGGGFFGDKPGKPPYKEYAETISRPFEGINYVTLIIEPGASLISSPISYLTTVRNIRRNGDKQFVTVDGSNIHINPMMHDIKFDIRVFGNKQGASCGFKQTICGFTCIEMDRMGEITGNCLVEIGDRIEFLNCGSYSMALSPLFIGYFPAVYVYENRRFQCVRKQWTEDEFIQKCEVAE